MVKNQEQMILESVQSLSRLCDQVIVYDTGSTDDTVVSVHTHFPNIIIRHLTWQEDFALMRNRCLEDIHADWILSLDADETIECSLSKSEFHTNLANIHSSYAKKDIILTVKQTVPGRGAFMRPQRIFTFSDSLYYAGIVHEEIRTNHPERLVSLDTDLVLINHGTSKHEIIKFSKRMRYMNSLEKMIRLEPNNPRWVSLLFPSNLKKTSFSEENYVACIRRVLLKNPKGSLAQANFMHSKYLAYLLENYVLFMIAHDDPMTQSLISEARKTFPLNSNFILFEYSEKIAKLDVANKLLLNHFLEAIKQLEQSATAEVIDESSQGAEESLVVPLLQLLHRLGRDSDYQAVAMSITSPDIRQVVQQNLHMGQDPIDSHIFTT